MRRGDGARHGERDFFGRGLNVGALKWRFALEILALCVMIFFGFFMFFGTKIAVFA